MAKYVYLRKANDDLVSHCKCRQFSRFDVWKQ